MKAEIIAIQKVFNDAECVFKWEIIMQTTEKPKAIVGNVFCKITEIIEDKEE